MKSLTFALFVCCLVLTLLNPAISAATKVYLMAGQSNMDGAADPTDPAVPQSLKDPQTDVKIYHVPAPATNGSWQDLRPGMSSSGNTFGPELTFGRAMADALPDDDIMIIKYAFGGTDLYSQWNSNENDLYPDFINKVNHALSLISGPYEIAGMCWQQGEKDARDDGEHKANAYQQNLTDLINSVRQDLNVPNMKFVLGYIPDLDEVDFSPLRNFPYTNIVQQAQLNVSLNVSNVFLIEESKDQLTFNDDLKHYDASGQMDLGNLYAQEMLIPEPATCALFSLGLIFLRKRKN